MNADFGGDGKNAKNLTILTAKANKTMTRFDNNIKNAVGELKKLYESVINNLYCDEYDLKKLRYGIQVTIEVSEEKWGAQPPDSYIAKSVKCKAKITDQNSLGDLLQKIKSSATKAPNEDLEKRIKKIEHDVQKANEKIEHDVRKANIKGDIPNN